MPAACCCKAAGNLPQGGGQEGYDDGGQYEGQGEGEFDEEQQQQQDYDGQDGDEGEEGQAPGDEQQEPDYEGGMTRSSSRVGSRRGVKKRDSNRGGMRRRRSRCRSMRMRSSRVSWVVPFGVRVSHRTPPAGTRTPAHPGMICMPRNRGDQMGSSCVFRGSFCPVCTAVLSPQQRCHLVISLTWSRCTSVKRHEVAAALGACK